MVDSIFTLIRNSFPNHAVKLVRNDIEVTELNNGNYGKSAIVAIDEFDGTYTVRSGNNVLTMGTAYKVPTAIRMMFSI